MTTHQMPQLDTSGYADVEAQITENVHTLIKRAGTSARRLEDAIGVRRGNLARRLSGETPWFYLHVRALAAYFSVTLDELEGTLPSRREWEERARLQGFEPRTF